MEQAAYETLVARIRAEIPRFLTEKRLSHTFFVEKEAISLAERVISVYNKDIDADELMQNLHLAALLHDITKKCTEAEQLTLCARYGILVKDGTSPEILHAFTGAHVAREAFGINDAVFSAIYKHTTGSERMSLCDALLFIADFTEESRAYEACVSTRTRLHAALASAKTPEDASAALCEAMKSELDSTITHLLEKGAVIDPETIHCRNALITGAISLN